MKHRNAAKREPAAQAREQTQGRETRPETSDNSRSSENAAGERDLREHVGKHQAEQRVRNTARRHRQSHDCGRSAAIARRRPMQQARPGRGRGSERVPAQQARPIEANPETPPPCSRRSLLERKSNLTHSKHAPTEGLPVRRRRQRGYKAPRPLCAHRRRRPADEAETRGGERKGSPGTPPRQSSTSQSYLKLTKEKVRYRPVRSKAGMKLSAAAGPSCQ